MHISAETEPERIALVNFQTRLRAEWGFHQSFGASDLLAKWKTAISNLERGNISEHDLPYELSLRDEIDTLIRSVPFRLGELIASFVQPLDVRFINATIPSKEPRLPALEGESQHERWFRRPALSGSGQFRVSD